jgi:DNA-binding PucR family transcriptional regulator
VTPPVPPPVPAPSQVPTPDAGRRVSQRAREIIRSAITDLMSDPDPLFSAVDAAVLATQSRVIQADPELHEAIMASSRSNLTHWAAQQLAAPGEPVMINPAPEPLALARMFALRGFEDSSHAAYGAGQNATWPFWMRSVFAQTSDPEELREVLEVSSESIFAFVDLMLAALGPERVSHELGYDTDASRHTAMIVWGDSVGCRVLESANTLAETIRPLLSRRPLIAMANPQTAWAWFPSDALRDGIEADLAEAAPSAVGVRIAIGSGALGYGGFVSSHADAELVQRLMLCGPDELRVASLGDLTTVALASADPVRASRFVNEVLGGLIICDEEVQETLHVYLQNRCSPSRTAQAMFTHRNTIIDRVRRAEAHLPGPVAGNELRLAMALELRRFFGPSGLGQLHRSTAVR